MLNLSWYLNYPHGFFDFNHFLWYYKKHCFLFFPIFQLVLFLNRFLIFLKKWAEIADFKEIKTFLPQKYVFVIIIWCTNMFFVHSSIIQYWFFQKIPKIILPSMSVFLNPRFSTSSCFLIFWKIQLVFLIECFLYDHTACNFLRKNIEILLKHFA